MTEDLEVMKQNLYAGYIEAFDDIHLNYLRPIKRDMYVCSAKCCEDETLPTDDYLECIVDCFMKTSGANYYISSTFDDFKRRYNTCIGKCDRGVGYDSDDLDDEGSDGEITAEELREESFADQPDSEHVMNSWFECLDKEDLEHEDEEKPDNKIDFKDRNTCTRLCTKAYVNVLNLTMDTVRRDLAATAIAKYHQGEFYYAWSRANEEDLPL